MLHTAKPYERPRQTWSEWASRADFVLLGLIAAVLAMSLIFIASAAQGIGNGGGAGYAGRQAVFIAMGTVIFLAIQRIEYMDLLKWSPLLYIIGIIMLIGVFFTRPINGARSWYNLYVFNFQPSEFMKIVIILSLARYLMYRDSYKRFTGLAAPLLLAMFPLALILKQPDLGTFLAFTPVVFVMLFAAGAKLEHLGILTVTGMGGVVGMWFTMMKEYQKRRVLAWLHPDQYRAREAWQLLRSEAAIGSGGFWGKGVGGGAREGLNTLPERHTDFIFAVVCEEGGFIIASLLMLLLFAAAIRGLGIARRTREPAGRLVATGCVATLIFQTLINTGVALGLLPTTGLTFPFVSYGGSSILSSFVCLGLLINIGARREPVLAREDFS